VADEKVNAGDDEPLALIVGRNRHYVLCATRRHRAPGCEPINKTSAAAALFEGNTNSVIAAPHDMAWILT
jgi:hypothetical protein